jgi:1,4-dihydroxy-2-naphthoyl-CoA hydrolase
MFTYETSVKLHNTDAAGLLFFADQFKLAHDAYELFMESIKFSFRHIIQESDFLLAIVHAEADFLQPLYSGDRITTKLRVEKIGTTSFTLTYDLTTTREGTVGTAKTVHVCIDKSSREKRELPDALVAALSEHT